MEKTIVILGAGGNSREIADIAALNKYRVLGFLVTDLQKIGPRDSRELILGDLSWLESNHVDAIAMGIGNPYFRLRISETVCQSFPEIDWPVLVHPTATISLETSKLGKGSILSAGVVATVNIVVEDFAQLNFGCMVGHESHIGKASLINPGTNIAGGVKIGQGVLVGLGANILQYLTIGDGATIGAGAVVTKDVPPDTTVVGVPAKPR